MSHELRRALDALVQDVATEQDARTRAGGGLPVATMTARAHRRRVRFTALVSAAVTCGLLAVAAGGVAVATWDRAEVQPAVPSPSGTPTPTRDASSPSATPSATPSRAATVLPSADPGLPFGACGSTLVAAAGLPSSSAVALTLAAGPASVLRGEPFEVRTELAATGTDVAAFGPDSGPTVLVLRDGVVVATAPTYPPGADVDSVDFVYADPSAPSTSAFVSHVAPVVCGAPGASVGDALPGGDYTVLAVSDAWTADRAAASEVVADGVRTITEIAAVVPVQQVVAVSPPVTVRVGSEPVDPATVPTPPASAPVLGDRNVPSGDPYPSACEATTTPGDAGGLLPVTRTVTAEGDAVTVTYTGSGRVALFVSGQFLRVVQDGVVVAVSSSPARQVDLDHGSAVTAAASTWLGCAAGWPGGETALAPGTYTAYPVALVGVLGLVAADGTEVQARGSEPDLHQLVGQPVTLVVP